MDSKQLMTGMLHLTENIEELLGTPDQQQILGNRTTWLIEPFTVQRTNLSKTGDRLTAFRWYNSSFSSDGVATDSSRYQGLVMYSLPDGTPNRLVFSTVDRGSSISYHIYHQ